jgi:phage repressor protein C with HTH and peptisase S24 domain
MTEIDLSSKRAESLNTPRIGNICYLVPASAQAGYAEGWSDEHPPRLSEVLIPGIQDEGARVFEVSGDSMNPILMDGDYVACTRVEDARHIRDGLIYVIVSRYGVSVKHVRVVEDHLLCTPENTHGFEAFEMQVEEVRELWEVKIRITRHILTGRLQQKHIGAGKGGSKLEDLLIKLLDQAGGDH